MKIKVEFAELMDGNIYPIFKYKCESCKEEMWINTVTRNPKKRDYFCVNCGTWVPQKVIDRIILEMELKNFKKNYES